MCAAIKSSKERKLLRLDMYGEATLIHERSSFDTYLMLCAGKIRVFSDERENTKFYC